MRWFVADGQFITLPSLRSLWLVVGMFPDDQLNIFLRTLRCPGLETMSITAKIPSDSDSPRYVPHRPGCSYELPTCASLRSLELRHVDCSRMEKDFNAADLPNLAQVTFYQCRRVMALLGTLISPVEDSTRIWPSLKVIRLDFPSLPEYEVDDLCKLLSFRIRCGASIDFVRFDSTDVDSVDGGKYAARLRELVRVETCW
jgi:hypothetical protein